MRVFSVPILGRVCGPFPAQGMGKLATGTSESWYIIDETFPTNTDYFCRHISGPTTSEPVSGSISRHFVPLILGPAFRIIFAFFVLLSPRVCFV